MVAPKEMQLLSPHINGRIFFIFLKCHIKRAVTLASCLVKGKKNKNKLRTCRVFVYFRF